MLVRLVPHRQLSLDQALEFLREDECVEVTPQHGAPAQGRARQGRAHEARTEAQGRRRDVSRRTRALLGGVAVVSGAAGVLHYAGAPALVAFVVAGVALAGLAWVVSFTTEQVGEHFGPGGDRRAAVDARQPAGVLRRDLRAVGGRGRRGAVLDHRLDLRQRAAGARLRDRRRRARRARTASCASRRGCRRTPRRCCCSSGFIIVLVGISANTHDRRATTSSRSRRSPRCSVLIVYGVWVYGYLRSEPPPPTAGRGRPARSPLRTSIILLALGGVGAAFVSEWFVDALRPTIDQLGISAQFAGPRDRRDRGQRGRARGRRGARRRRARPTSRSRS